MTQAVLGKDGKLRDLPTQNDQEKPDASCAFAGMAMAGTLPGSAPAQTKPFSAAQPFAPHHYTVTVGRGLAAPPPPATGPPILI